MKAQTEKLAKASPYYARLLSSVRGAGERRRKLARMLNRRRKRAAFERALRDARAAG